MKCYQIKMKRVLKTLFNIKLVNENQILNQSKNNKQEPRRIITKK